MKKQKKGQRSTKSVEWEKAPDIEERTNKLIKNLDLEWLSYGRLFFYRSTNSKARAYARAWGLPRLWQRTLNVEPAYIVEVISEHFDKLSQKEQDKILLHELTHIPKNFSGALVAHTRKRKGSFHDKLDILLNQYYSSNKNK
ncbi:MAG: putative metallopeptidase [Candidatus Woesebacteria bacterium]|nr:putative metallopeptidase [Candidatus Woesebacteria bacterium]